MRFPLEPEHADAGRGSAKRQGDGYRGAVGDSFQIIADVEAPEAEAPALAADVIGWLSGAGIVGAEQADCVLGAAAGYPPGRCYAAAVTTPDERLFTLRTNGVEVHTTRSVFYPVQGELGPVTCPRCGHRMELEDPPTGVPTAHWEPFNEALDEWMAGEPADVTCPRCRRASGLNDWQWTGEWPLAVGFLGFTFWNWPALSEPFIAQLAAYLGHRLVVTQGKI